MATTNGVESRPTHQHTHSTTPEASRSSHINDQDEQAHGEEEEDEDKNASRSPAAKRTQTCFRCRQSKVKCVFDENSPTTCRRCTRLAVSCELQGKREPLSWQMRVQNQLAALEGSLQSFLEKQAGSSAPAQQPQTARMYPTTPDEHSARSSGSTGDIYHDRPMGPKKRRRTNPAGQVTATATTAGSPLSHQSHYADTSETAYQSTFSPRYTGAERNQHQDGAEVLQAFASQSHGYGSTPRASGPSSGGAVASDASRSAFTSGTNEDEQDQASRPLAAIQKLRMSVLDRKKDLPPSGERVFPNLYHLATADVGCKDPRPNVVKQNLVSAADAVALFRFYAEYLDQYSFGFPTYRPDAIMSPMILTSVVTVASLHHAQLNSIHLSLKRDLMARLQTDDPSFPCSDVYETLFSSSIATSSEARFSNSHHLQFEKELDPELGIGVEEIVGASLFATWFGGKRAWMASRLARWWSAKFLRQQQHPAMMTMGEIMSILPPPRDLGKQDLLRVWLSAYVTEIHQACMEGTSSIAGFSSPFAVCDSLQYARGLPQRTSLRDRILILHSKIAYIVSKAYHIAGSGNSDWSKTDGASAKESRNAARSAASRTGSNRDKSSPSEQCPTCRGGNRDGQSAHRDARADAISSTSSPSLDASACLQSILDALEDLDACQEEMASKLDAHAIGEPESMLYLDLFLARVLIASIGCDFLDSTLWDGSLGQLSSGGRGRRSSIGRGNSTAEAELQDVRNRTLRESLTRGVEAAMRSLELVCLAAEGDGQQGRATETTLNLLVLPLWFHWALTRSVLFLMNMLAEYPERLLPRDRARSAVLIHTFLDTYSKYIGHANMVLSHGPSQRTAPADQQLNAWSSSQSDANNTLGPRTDRHSRNSNTAATLSIPSDSATFTGGNAADLNATAPSAGWHTTSNQHGTLLQHPATPLLDTLHQCLTWARHGAVL